MKAPQLSPMQGCSWSAGKINGQQLVVDDYPFRDFVERKNVKVLRNLLGPGAQHGMAILVTGPRGSGKTSAVHKAIYDAGLLGRGFLQKDLGFDEASRGDVIRLTLKSPGKEPKWVPSLVLEVPINIASPIAPIDLNRRILRQFYLALVNAGLVGLAPELVSRAREAYLRSCAKYSEIQDETLKETLSNSLKVTLSAEKGAAVEAGAAAQTERTIARRIALEFDVSTKEQMDDQLLEMLESIQGSTLGPSPGMFERLGNIIDWTGAVEAIGKFVVGSTGIDVHIVFILDELDKLSLAETEHPAAPPVGTNDSRTRLPAALETGLAEWLAPNEPKITNLVGLIRSIKPILTSGRASFVVISGEEDAALMKGRGRELLESVFSAHLSFGPLSSSEIGALLERYWWQGRTISDGARELFLDVFLLHTQGHLRAAVGLLHRLRAEEKSGDSVLRTWAKKEKKDVLFAHACGLLRAALKDPSLLGFNESVEPPPTRARELILHWAYQIPRRAETATRRHPEVLTQAAVSNWLGPLDALGMLWANLTSGIETAPVDDPEGLGLLLSLFNKRLIEAKGTLEEWKTAP